MRRFHLLSAVLVGAVGILPIAAAAQYYGYGNQQAYGVINWVHGSNIQLVNRQPIFLHQGTVINPSGTTLRAGMLISVSGSPGGNGAINANVINVVGNGYGANNPYGYGNPGSYGYGNPVPYGYGNSAPYGYGNPNPTAYGNPYPYGYAYPRPVYTYPTVVQRNVYVYPYRYRHRGWNRDGDWRRRGWWRRHHHED